MQQISVIIPAYKPDEKLLTTVGELIEQGFTDILVVDDGDGEAYAPIFAEIGKLSQCTLLRHEVNRGKGAALKTAFSYFLKHRATEGCVVTADADGQHLTRDILAVGEKALETGAIVLGARNFTKPDVPARSKAGNQITRVVFRLFFGMKLQDTQTGLRAFPGKYLEEMLQVEGDRYEYETNMLFHMNRCKIPFDEVEISTVYIEENQSSHFRVVQDSIRIYALILKYLFSSTAAAVVDAVGFYVFKKFTFLEFLPIPLTFTASILARVISSLINYFCNAKVVFKGKTNGSTLVRYYLLAVAQIAISASSVFVIEYLLGIAAPVLSTMIKILVDTVLFFFSFRIQHCWVFRDKVAGGEETEE